MMATGEESDSHHACTFTPGMNSPSPANHINKTHVQGVLKDLAPSFFDKKAGLLNDSDRHWKSGNALCVTHQINKQVSKPVLLPWTERTSPFINSSAPLTITAKAERTAARGPRPGWAEDSPHKTYCLQKETRIWHRKKIIFKKYILNL